MTATLAEIRTGLANNLKTLTGGEQAVQINPYMLDNPTPPCFQIMGPEETTYDHAMKRGLDQWMIVIQGFVGSPTDIGAQVLLDIWLDPASGKSVKRALETDKQLGNKVQDLQVVSASGYRIYNLNSQAGTLGAEWTIMIYNTGS